MQTKPTRAGRKKQSVITAREIRSMQLGLQQIARITWKWLSARKAIQKRLAAGAQPEPGLTIPKALTSAEIPTEADLFKMLQ